MPRGAPLPARAVARRDLRVARTHLWRRAVSRADAGRRNCDRAPLRGSRRSGLAAFKWLSLQAGGRGDAEGTEDKLLLLPAPVGW